MEPRVGGGNPLEEEREEVRPGGGVFGKSSGGEFRDGVAEFFGDGFERLFVEGIEEEGVERGACGGREVGQEEGVMVAREVAAEEDGGTMLVGRGIRLEIRDSRWVELGPKISATWA